MANRRNCNRITHLTPAKLIKVNIMITNAATLLSIQGFGSSVGEINPAMDSPNPVAHKALPKFKKKKKSLICYDLWGFPKCSRVPENPPYFG